MRLASVEISNYRVIRHAAIEFPDSLIGIIGPNGAGKSSLVEAISWALYGQQAARSARAEVKSTFASPDEPCEVQVTFEVRGEEHQVIRRLVGSSQRLEVELYRGGNLEVVGSMETQQYIERLLGLDWRGYVTSVYARQSDLDAFSGLQPARRREHLVAMLGIDRLDRAIDRAKGDIRLDTERAVLLDKQVTPIADTETAFGRLKERLAAAETAFRDASGARDAQARELSQIEAHHAEHEARKASCSQIESQLELARAESRRLELQMDQLRAESAGLEQLRIMMEGSRPELERLEPARVEVRQWEKARESAAARRRILGELETARQRQMETEKAVRDTEARRADTRRALSESPPISLQELETRRTELELDRERYLRLSEQKKQIERESARLKENLAQIASLGGEAVCSRCLRPYGNDLEQITVHLKDELRQTDAQAREIDEQLRVMTQSGVALKEKVAGIEKMIEQRRALQQSLELAETQCKQAEAQHQMLGERLESLQRQLNEIGETAYDEVRWRDLTVRLAELERLSRKAVEAEGQLKRLPVVQELIGKLASEMRTVSSRREGLEKRRAEIAFDPEQFALSGAKVERAAKAARTAHERCIEAGHLRELLANEASVTERRLIELKEVERELTAVRARRTRTDRLVKVFGDLRRNLVAGIRPRLAEIGSELLDDMTAGRYNLMELDEDYSISVIDNGHSFGIDRFSGGENDLANLCLRLAVSLALAESAGLERSLVILDEVFGSQDESRRELIYQGLAALKPRFPQIIAITHIEELKNRVETLIEVVPTGNGWSEVRVDGVVA